MKKRAIFFSVCLIVLWAPSFAQKKLLNFSTPGDWPSVKFKKISNDGKYVTYESGTPHSGTHLIVQSIDLLFKKEIGNVNESIFTEDSRHLIFSTKGDSLCIINLAVGTSNYIEKVSSFKLPKNGGGEWLAYQLADLEQELVVSNLITGEQIHYPKVNDYLFSDNGEKLLVLQDNKNGARQNLTLEQLNRKSSKGTIIGTGNDISNLTFSNDGTACAFLSTESKGDNLYKSIQYFREGMDSATSLVEPSTDGVKGMLPVGGIFFNNRGDKIYFLIEKADDLLPKKPEPGLTVTVSRYQSAKQEEVSFLTVINLSAKNKVIRLQQDKDHYPRFFKEKNDDFVLIEGETTGNDQQRKISARPDIFLVSTTDGTRKLLKSRVPANDFYFSPSGKYTIWYNGKDNAWVTYNIKNGSFKNITSGLPSDLFDENPVPRFPLPCGMAGWLENDSAVFIYDRYDIWQVDPEGEKHPVNITGGYGRKHNIQLRFISFPKGDLPSIFPKDSVLISAINFSNKWSGFFRLGFSGDSRLKQLTMEPRQYYFPYRYAPCFLSYSDPFYPAKAKNARAYVVSRSSATEYPNLYITKDFKDFKPLTDFAPQAGYNWYRSELVHWNTFDNKPAEGSLYKPENFDPRKKYPIIFYYYERAADELNAYLKPELSNGIMNIPWFVSNGYLVFVPDIYQKVGFPGQCAYNSIVSAAKYLSKFAWVDAKHMGLQGHSYGGFETNYIVTRTNLFAAAATSAGTSDVVGEYTQFDGAQYYETGQGRIGTTLWETPKLYFDNSPILKADKVTIPMLIMHNRADGSVNFSQGLSWYGSLVHLGKKAWMLTYDGETHTIKTEKNQLDYSIRLAQFFDYYLKGAIPPKWMTEGSKSLELDTSGKQP